MGGGKMNPTTDTPRTVSAMSLKKNEELSEKDCLVYENYVHAEVCAQIERELNASKAEVAKLNHQLLKTESDLLQSQDISSFLDSEFRIACKRAEKAEAEVERLKEQLESTQNLCFKFWSVLEENGFELEINQ
jgi:thymidylate kinase